MSFKSLKSIFSFSRKQSPILVCETDGFTLRGAVIGRDGEGLRVLYAARSDSADFKVAVADVVSILRKQGWLGDKAVLLTPGVLSTVVELPVDPKTKRPDEQMLELVRWELEPLLMQHTTLWSVGRILVGLGFLTEAQANEVLTHQQGRNSGVGGVSSRDVFSFKRYGELAIEMGYINHAQMDECLTRQIWLQSSGETISCGWVAQPIVDLENGEAGHYPWLVSGVNQGMMQQWTSAFLTGGVVLESMYPIVGCAATAPELHTADDDLVLIEVSAGLVAGVKVSHGAVTAVNLQQSNLQDVLDASLEAYHVLTPPEPASLLLATIVGESDSLEISLTSMLGRPVNQIARLQDDVSAGMAGAARHALKLVGSSRCSGVSVQGPKVPLFQRIEVRAIAMALLLLGVVVAAEVTLQVRQNMAHTVAEKVNKEAAQMSAAVNKVQVKIDEIKKLKQSIKANNEMIESIKKRTQLLTVDAPARSAFVVGLLSDLASLVPEDMVLERVQETRKDGLSITAWSLSEKSAQQFVKNFQTKMEVFGYKAANVSVTSQNGRLNLYGYILRFNLMPPTLVPPAEQVK